MTGVVKVPSNVSSITLGDGAHVPDANGLLTDASDSDFTILVDPVHPVRLIFSAGNGNITLGMPPNISSITINSIVYTPDGTLYNVITGPAVDFTTVYEQGFKIIDSLT